jgi:glucosaminylphosphatidylinositol acyltransferase
MSSVSSYKLEKEAFVSGNLGSSIPHILAISSAAVASIALYYSLRTRGIFVKKSEDALPDLSFKLQFPVLIFPLLLSMTLFAHHPSLFTVGLIIPTAIIVLLMPRRDGKNYLPRSTPSRQPSPKPSSSTPTFVRSASPVEEVPVSKTELSIPPLPALSTYRAHMMLVTIIAILAVDFPVFPRVLGKTESFGVSWVRIHWIVINFHLE